MTAWRYLHGKREKAEEQERYKTKREISDIKQMIERPGMLTERRADITEMDIYSWRALGIS
ncbi:hypothetical protein HYZ97_04765 [Candidatus Pacearchaeota archaeon]|nr:hypothetical protein [Candidatus Pacearchaeota archaeon]